MNTMLLALALLASPLSASDSGVVGDWEGTLVAGTMRLRIVFHLERSAGGTFAGTMDSPDQGARGIPLSGVRVEGDSLRMELRSAGGAFTGALRGDEIIGTWSQSGLTLALTLRRTAPLAAPRRPQEPVPPLPYDQEEVSWVSPEAGVTLVGTLTLPPREGAVPAVVLVSGSGPQDRDGTVFGHRPFLVLADHLTRAGIAVLRYDDRGVGASTGSLRGVRLEDLAGDARSAVRFLAARPGIDSTRIGLVGHSEGGLIASIVAAERAAFLVLLATPGVPGDELLLLQSQALARGAGTDEEGIAKAQALNSLIYARVKAGGDSAEVASDARRMIASWADSLSEAERTGLGDIDEFLSRQIPIITSPWFRSFVAHDPQRSLRRVACPVLAVTGSKDLQVTPAENLAGIREALTGNARVLVRELPGLNHLLQTSGSGLPAEYGTIEETVAPAALTLIVDWIVGTVSRPGDPSPSGRP